MEVGSGNGSTTTKQHRKWIPKRKCGNRTHIFQQRNKLTNNQWKGGAGLAMSNDVMNDVEDE